MGRLDFRKMKYLYNQFLYRGLKKLPYKYKKPLILVSSILGLIAYYRMVLWMTKSKYLYMIMEFMNEMKNLFSSVDQKLITLTFVLLFVLLLYRYMLPTGNGDHRKSLYREINSAISFCYIGVTVLGILPLFGV